MTKISEKGIENAARAICEERTCAGAWERANEVDRIAWLRDARAAIAAYLDVVEGEKDQSFNWMDERDGICGKQDTQKGGDVFARPVNDARVDIGAGVSANMSSAEALASDPAPAGWRMVPVEPTEAQIELLAKAYDHVSFDPEEDGLLDVAQPIRDRARYNARLLYPLLLAAAPEPPVSDSLVQQAEIAFIRADAYRAGQIAMAEADMRIVEAVAESFLSTKYASNQPLGSFCERYACEVIAKGILANAERLRVGNEGDGE